MSSTVAHAAQIRPGQHIYRHDMGQAFRRVVDVTSVASSGVLYVTLDGGEVLSLHMRTFVSVLD